MHPVSGIVVFIIIWWSVIFCVLPIGQHTQYEESEDEEVYTAPGSPKQLNMKKKLFITTIISVILWLITYFVIEMEIIDFRQLALED